MKNMLILMALLAAAPFAACAQSNAGNIQQGGAAMAERQAASRTTAAPGYYSATPSRAERKRTKARRKANNDAWEADKAAHNGTEMRPGGFRWDPRTEQMINPDGTYVGEPKNGRKRSRK